MAANPFPRRTFVIPGEAGQADRTINMIEIDDALKTADLALLNAATTDQAPRTSPLWTKLLNTPRSSHHAPQRAWQEL